MVNRELLAAIRTALMEQSDAVRAAGAQAYMKSPILSLGVRVPEVRRLVIATAAAFPFDSPEQLRATVLELWRTAQRREERYAAIELTGLRLVAKEPQMLPVYEEIIRTGAWWDFWIRRAAITAQLKAKGGTDTGLLRGVIEANLADPEFFIRKAIGWALREYAKTNSLWVRDFVAEHRARLSPLSRNEALRHLTPDRKAEPAGSVPDASGS